MSGQYFDAVIVVSSDKPCIRRLSPQYERQSKIRCPNKTIRQQLFSSQLTKIKTVREFLWPLKVVNLNITGLI